MSSNQFDLKANQWDEKPERRQLADAVARALIAHGLPPTAQALEFGCGTGLVGLQIAPYVDHLLAIDSSRGMIEVLQAKIEEQAITNVTPVTADILSHDTGGMFDCIFTSMTLHHVDDIEPILARFHELLKDDGFVAIADLDAEDGSFHGNEMEEKHHGFGRDELTRMLTAQGFAKPQFSIAHTIEKPDKEGVKKKYPVFFATMGKR